MTARIFDIGELSRFVFHCSEEGRNFAIVAALLESYLDDSSDEKRKDVFCVGAFLAHEQNLKAMQIAWMERLKTPDDIPYFRATACKGVHEPFFKLREKYGPQAWAIANRIRADLENILLSHHWIGFGLGILVSEYKEVWNSIPAAKNLYRQDPVEAAFSQMFFEIARAVQNNAPEHQVAFIVDDSTYSGQIAEAFKALKINHASLAPSMATLAPLDDKITPPLQMADLIASIVKDVFREWLTKGRPEHLPLELKWHSHFERIGKWDKEHMLDSIGTNLNDPRYAAKAFPERPAPEPTRTELKRKEKQRRKALIKSSTAKKVAMVDSSHDTNAKGKAAQ